MTRPGQLHLHLYGTYLGAVTEVGTFGDRSYGFAMQWSAEALRRWRGNSTVLSASLPLRGPVSTRGARKKESEHLLAYLFGLSPEGRMLSGLERARGIARGDVFDLLSHYGLEVAGAVTVSASAEPPVGLTPRYEPVSDDAVAEMVARVERYPIGNLPDGGRMSLAGVQGKILLARVGGSWNLCLDGAPSTHILKPAHPEIAGTVPIEAGTMQLARSLGLTTVAASVFRAAGQEAYVVSRFDRSVTASGTVERLHQEDACQALGISPGNKYQRDPGGPNLRRVASVLDGPSVGRDRAAGKVQLLRQVTFAVAVGDTDQHGKNISFLHPAQGPMTLAPLYDCVPYMWKVNAGRTGEMAMAVNGQYDGDSITAGDLVQEGTSWGIPEPAARDAVMGLLAGHGDWAEIDTDSPGDLVTYVCRRRAALVDGDRAGRDR